MSEATETAAATPTPTAETPAGKIPGEIQDQINKEHSAINKMDKAELIAKAAEVGLDVKADQVNEKWLSRKLKYVVQELILKQHGLTETPMVKKNREKLEASDPNAPPSVGRKKMTTLGSYTLALGEGGKEGRSNSCKGKIVADMKALGVFTYEQFRQSVSNALQWNEDQAAFLGDTRFKTLDVATGAWWSELKNKAKIIVEAPKTQ